jgi:hypothetical protein
MAAQPLIEEISGGPAGAMISGLAGLAGAVRKPAHEELIENRRPTYAATGAREAHRRTSAAGGSAVDLVGRHQRP